MVRTLQNNTYKLLQRCTDTLVGNLRLWRVQELVSRFIESILYEIGKKHKSLTFYKFSVTKRFQ
nr:MAG TPA: hypothetical protein [Caudoviricetes sp.]